MNYPASTRAIFLAGMVFASGAFAASSDIKKCVTESGHVTLTDAVCPGDTRAVTIINVPASAGTERVPDNANDRASTPAQRLTATSMPARYPVHYATLGRNAAPLHAVSLDTATLKAARANMQMVDNAAESSRAQRLAGLQ